MKVERTQDQGTHLTHPCVLVGRVANRVAPLSHQLVELEVYRLGREYKGEVTLTAQLAQEASHAYVAARAHGCLGGPARGRQPAAQQEGSDWQLC